MSEIKSSNVDTSLNINKETSVITITITGTYIIRDGKCQTGEAIDIMMSESKEWLNKYWS